jgi:hypothetical protein
MISTGLYVDFGFFEKEIGSLHLYVVLSICLGFSSYKSLLGTFRDKIVELINNTTVSKYEFNLPVDTSKSNECFIWVIFMVCSDQCSIGPTIVLKGNSHLGDIAPLPHLSTSITIVTKFLISSNMQHSDEHTSVSEATPATSSDNPASYYDQWDGWTVATPWPGETFMIIERSTNQALVGDSGELSFQQRNPCNDQKLWLCVETSGFFGFQNKKTSKYISCNLKNNLNANASRCLNWEYILPRKHPKGGYQLLMPTWNGLQVVNINEEGNGLVLRPHGATTWDFVKNG